MPCLRSHTKGVKIYEKYIFQLVSEFEYTDFKPPIDPEILKDRFKEIIDNDNVYWKKLDDNEKPMKPTENSFFIEFKSFATNNPVYAQFQFTSKEIHIRIFSDLQDTGSYSVTDRREIKLFYVWLKHKDLYDNLAAILETEVRLANGY